jgi:hypothetical protein
MQRYLPHEDFDVDIIWQNLYAESDFSVYRKQSTGPVERILVDLAKVIEAGVMEQVISVCATKHTVSITVACTKQWEDVKDKVTGVL